MTSTDTILGFINTHPFQPESFNLKNNYTKQVSSTQAVNCLNCEEKSKRQNHGIEWGVSEIFRILLDFLKYFSIIPNKICIEYKI
jgi:hypothetical protein